MEALYPGQIGIEKLLVFVEGGKWKNQEKIPHSKARIDSKLNPHMTSSFSPLFPTGGIGCPQLTPTQLHNWKLPEGIYNVSTQYYRTLVAI